MVSSRRQAQLLVLSWVVRTVYQRMYIMETIVLKVITTSSVLKLSIDIFLFATVGLKGRRQGGIDSSFGTEVYNKSTQCRP